LSSLYSDHFSFQLTIRTTGQALPTTDQALCDSEGCTQDRQLQGII